MKGELNTLVAGEVSSGTFGEFWKCPICPKEFENNFYRQDHVQGHTVKEWILAGRPNLYPLNTGVAEVQ